MWKTIIFFLPVFLFSFHSPSRFWIGILRTFSALARYSCIFKCTFVQEKISYFVLWHKTKTYLGLLHLFSVFLYFLWMNVFCKMQSRQLKNTNFSALYSLIPFPFVFWFPSSLLDRDILRSMLYCEGLSDTVLYWESTVSLKVCFYPSRSKKYFTASKRTLEIHKTYIQQKKLQIMLCYKHTCMHRKGVIFWNLETHVDDKA